MNTPNCNGSCIFYSIFEDNQITDMSIFIGIGRGGLFKINIRIYRYIYCSGGII